MRKSVLGIILACVLCALPAFSQDILGDRSSIPQGTVSILDNFEKGNYWIWAAFDWEFWGPPKLSTSARLSSHWASEGRQSLECKVAKSTPDSDLSGMFYMDFQWNFSGTKYVVLDIYNPENTSFEFSMAFQTSEAWKWNETRTVLVEPGAHTVVLSVQDFMSELSLVYRVNLCYKETTPMNGRFFVDNIRFIK